MQALFDGRIILWERHAHPTPERKAFNKRIEEENEYFAGKMTPDDRKRFNKLIDLYIEAAYDEEVEIYTYGFTLGAFIMMKLMEKKDSIVDK